ncbi:MAG: magnesium transporter CorA family protein, partial [Enterococcus viikkiensis]
MIDYFTISDTGVKKSVHASNWLAVDNPSDAEKEQLHEAYDLPKNFFALGQ